MPMFKAMTWNVENLFRPTPDAGPAADTAYRSKLDLLSAALVRLDPDIVAFQEVGGPEALEDLRHAAGDLFGHTAFSAFSDGRGIRVGFLSRHAIEQTEDITEFPAGLVLRIGTDAPLTRMGRGALRVRIRPHGLPIELVTAHLKSKLLSFTAAGGGTRFQPRNEAERAQAAVAALARRAAEAAAVRAHADGLLVGNQNTRLILLGDMNDVPEAATSQILLGPPGSEIGTPGFNRPDRGDDARLFNLAPLIPAERRFSRIFRGQGELIDQILVSAEMMPLEPEGRRRLPIADAHVGIAGDLPSIEDDPQERSEAAVPDHAPVTATFIL